MNYSMKCRFRSIFFYNTRFFCQNRKFCIFYSNFVTRTSQCLEFKYNHNQTSGIRKRTSIRVCRHAARLIQSLNRKINVLNLEFRDQCLEVILKLYSNLQIMKEDLDTSSQTFGTPNSEFVWKVNVLNLEFRVQCLEII